MKLTGCPLAGHGGPTHETNFFNVQQCGWPYRTTIPWYLQLISWLSIIATERRPMVYLVRHASWQKQLFPISSWLFVQQLRQDALQALRSDREQKLAARGVGGWGRVCFHLMCSCSWHVSPAFSSAATTVILKFCSMEDSSHHNPCINRNNNTKGQKSHQKRPNLAWIKWWRRYHLIPFPSAVTDCRSGRKPTCWMC